MKKSLLFAVFLGVLLGWGLFLGWGVIGLNPILVAIAVTVLYASAVWFDLLPPGHGRFNDDLDRGVPDEDRVARAAPVVAGETGDTGLSFAYQSERTGSEPGTYEGRAAVVPIALIGVAATGLTALAIFAMLRSGDDDDPSPASATTETPTPAPTAEPSPSRTATRTPTATPSPTATPTEAPRPTATPIPPKATPTQGSVQQPIGVDVSGTWSLVDTVTAGPGTGDSYEFDVELKQEGAKVSGGGSGLTISGTISGNLVSATFTRSGGSGTFSWRVTGNTFAGSFEDFGAANSGSSTGKRNR